MVHELHAPRRVAASAGAGRLLSRPLRPLTIGLVALASLIAFEALAVGAAMPTVARELDGLRLYALAFGGPLAAGVVSMVLSGAWSDRRGAAAPLRHGVAWFAAGLVVAGFARHMWIFVLGRVVQGFGAGLVAVALYVVVGHLFPAALRPRIFAALAGAWVLPSIVGPSIVGPWIVGLIVEHAGWRWVFLGVPLLAVPAAGLLAPGLPAPSVTRRDGAPADPRRLWWALGAALGVGLLYVGGQQRGIGVLVLLTVGMAAVARFVPLLLSRERGLSPALAGLALTISALTWFAGSWLQGRPGQPLSRTRLLQLGMALIVAGIAAVALLVVPSVPVLVGMVPGGWPDSA